MNGWMDEWSQRSSLSGVLEGTLWAILGAGPGPRDLLPCGLAVEDDLSGLSTPQPPPGLTGLVDMGPWRDPEGLR